MDLTPRQRRERAGWMVLFAFELGATALFLFLTGVAAGQLKDDQDVMNYYRDTNPPATFVAQEQETVDDDRNRLFGHIAVTLITAGFAGTSYIAISMYDANPDDEAGEQ